MTRVARLTTSVDGDALSIRVLAPERTRSDARRPSSADSGLVFLPPLIGGSGLHQAGYFRDLSRMGYRIATFDYRGHGKSGGKFCVENALADGHAAVAALERAGYAPPYFGIGVCFGALPLLACAHARRDLFGALSLINPIPSLQYAVPRRKLLSNYYFEGGRFRLRNPFDARGILAATNTLLFPEIDKSREHFGILRYERALGRRAVSEYMRLDALAGVQVDVPSRVAYGRSDTLLELDRPAREADYRARWRALCSQVDFVALEDVDHYWNGTRRVASRLSAELFAHVAGDEFEPHVISTPAKRPIETTSSVA